VFGAVLVNCEQSSGYYRGTDGSTGTGIVPVRLWIFGTRSVPVLFVTTGIGAEKIHLPNTSF